MKRKDLSEFLHSAVPCNSNCGFETKLLLSSVFLKVSSSYPNSKSPVNWKEQAVNCSRRREKVSRNQIAPVTGAAPIQATLGNFVKKKIILDTIIYDWYVCRSK